MFEVTETSRILPLQASTQLISYGIERRILIFKLAWSQIIDVKGVNGA